MHYFSNYQLIKKPTADLFSSSYAKVTMSLNMSHYPKSPENKEPTWPCFCTPAVWDFSVMLPVISSNLSLSYQNRILNDP